MEMSEIETDSTDLNALSDRELLLSVARDMQFIRNTVAENAPAFVGMIQKVEGNPMLKMLLGR